MASDVPAGIVRSKDVEHRAARSPDRRTRRCGSGSRAPGRPVGATRSGPGLERPALPHGGLQAEHRGHRRRRPVEGPAQAPERDGAHPHRHLGEHDHLPQVDAARPAQQTRATRRPRGWLRARRAGSTRAASRAGAWPCTGGRAAGCGARRTAPSPRPRDRTGAAPWPRADPRRAGRRTPRPSARPGPRRCCGPSRPHSPAGTNGSRARPRPARAAPTT